MQITARLLTLLAVFLFAAACQHNRSSKPAGHPAATRPIAPSSRLIVGRIAAIDAPRGFAFVQLAADAPPAAQADGAELTARTNDLRETAQLRASRYLRGRTLGAIVVSGQPSPGDEVVWLAP